MSNNPTAAERRAPAPRNTRPAWLLMFIRELTDLWIGGKALVLILIYTVLLGVISFVFASNSEVNLMPPKEMVFEMLRISMAFGGLIGLIIGADSISGERERATLEWLLVTPANRSQLVIGKFMAAASPWPAALAVSIPYWWWLAQGDPAFGQALLWGTVLGSLIVPGLTGLGMLVSFWSNTNRGSMFVSLTLYLLVLIPTQLPGSAQTGAMGKLFKKVSPMESAYHFLEKIIVNNRTLDELSVFLLAPALFCGIVLALLWYSSSNLRLETGQTNRLGKLLARFTGLLAILLVLGVTPAHALQGGGLDTPYSLQIVINEMEFADVKAGDAIEYSTTVTNSGTEASPALIVAMNIINLDSEGDVVDPEDWSPERTQYSQSLAAGEAVSFDWRINAILDGDYMVYMVVIPEPGGPQFTSLPVASSGIHLTVAPNPQLNPGGVLPLVIIVPVAVVLGMGFLFWRRRQAIDPGLS